ncbi:MAG: hypothetical protein NXI10_15620 [bacterium]|nr:hypothetical protein [bacterium]
MRLYHILLAGLFLMTACDNSKDTKETDSPTEESTKDTVAVEKPTYPEEARFDDFAKFIAGTEGRESSELKALEATDTWQAYRMNLDNLWLKTNQKLPAIKDWTAKELSDVNTSEGTLFYPFSGADFLHADLFFPEHDNIVMMALEPVGDFADLNEKNKDGTLTAYLNGLKRAMNAILRLSFFRTIAMASDFQSEMDGTLHVLVHFMSRTGHELMYQEKVAIQPDGTLTNDLTSVADSAYVGNRFYFRSAGEEKVKTLTYFAVNVQNTAYHSRGGLVAKGLDERKDLVNYLKNIDIKSTYLKSASYLMHRETFSIIRNLILDESEYLLQDDSGIPVRFFDQNKWDLTFYGTYSFPISLFAERHQEDLKEIYVKKEMKVKPLPFGIGYQYRKGTSNLMLARKK